jgi:hypothetical protein
MPGRTTGTESFIPNACYKEVGKEGICENTGGDIYHME